MKKFLLLAAAACVGLSVSAKMYIIGEPAGAWNPTMGVELTEVETGVYQYTGNLAGKFFAFADQLGSNSNDWATLNAHRWGPATNNQLAGVGEYTAVYAKDASWSGGTGELTYTLNTNTKKLIVTGVAIPDVITYAIHGDLTTTEWTDFALTEKDGKWETDVTVTKQGNFGIKKMNHGNQIDWYSSAGAAAVTVNEVMKCSTSGSNFTIAAGEYHFAFDPAAETLLVTGEGGVVTIDYSTWYVNVKGDFNDWLDNGVNPNAEGVATLENLEIGTSPFKIMVYNGADDIWYSNGEANAVDTPITITGNTEANMTIEGAKAGDIYNVTFDCKNGVMTIVKVGGATVNYPELYVSGSFSNWATEEQYLMTREGNVYTYVFPEGINVGLGEEEQVFFIQDESGDYWFGPEVTEEADYAPLVLDKENDAYLNTYGIYLLQTENTKCVVTLTIPEGALVEGSGVPAILRVDANDVKVENLASDNAEAVYFNLQGVRVANPEKGMFIKVQGNKTSKVAL